MHFQHALCHPDISRLIDKFNSQIFDESPEGIELATASLHNIMTSAANRSLQRVKKKKKTSKKWFSPDLAKMRREVKKAGRIHCLHPSNAGLRANYHILLRAYRKRCKQDFRDYKQKLIFQLDSLQDANPRAYWKLVKELQGGKESSPDLDPKIFYDHYKHLNQDNRPLSEERAELIKKLAELESSPSFNSLDFRITETEITKAIMGLKTNKAQGLDLVRNEMLKSGQQTLLKSLKKLFNLILVAGSYPSCWGVGRVVSIHKKGDMSDPSNFRGITISSAMGKLFNAVMNNRLCDFLEENNILCPEQIGFRKKCRTSDHMFILKTLIEKYKRSRKPLYISVRPMTWYDTKASSINF